MTGQSVAYIRVSSVDQNTDRQLDGMTFDRTFTDRTSGKSIERPQLQEMLTYLREGDTLTVHSIDRLARNLVDLRTMVSDLTGRGVQVRFVKEAMTFSGEDSPMAVMLLNIMGAFAEFERALIRERQREGIKLAREAGKYSRKGRRPVMTIEQVTEARSMISERYTKGAVAKHFGVSRAVLYKYLKGAE